MAKIQLDEESLNFIADLTGNEINDTELNLKIQSMPYWNLEAILLDLFNQCFPDLGLKSFWDDEENFQSYADEPKLDGEHFFEWFKDPYESKLVWDKGDYQEFFLFNKEEIAYLRIISQLDRSHHALTHLALFELFYGSEIRGISYLEKASKFDSISDWLLADHELIIETLLRLEKFESAAKFIELMMTFLKYEQQNERLNYCNLTAFLKLGPDFKNQDFESELIAKHLTFLNLGGASLGMWADGPSNLLNLVETGYDCDAAISTLHRKTESDKVIGIVVTPFGPWTQFRFAELLIELAFNRAGENKEIPLGPLLNGVKLARVENEGMSNAENSNFEIKEFIGLSTNDIENNTVQDFQTRIDFQGKVTVFEFWNQLVSGSNERSFLLLDQKFINEIIDFETENETLDKFFEILNSQLGLRKLADFYDNQGMYSSAICALERLKCAEPWNGSVGLVDLYTRTEKYDSAEKIYREMLDNYKSELDHIRRNFGIFLFNNVPNKKSEGVYLHHIANRKNKEYAGALAQMLGSLGYFNSAKFWYVNSRDTDIERPNLQKHLEGDSWEELRNYDFSLQDDVENGDLFSLYLKSWYDFINGIDDFSAYSIEEFSKRFNLDLEEPSILKSEILTNFALNKIVNGEYSESYLKYIRYPISSLTKVAIQRPEIFSEIDQIVEGKYRVLSDLAVSHSGLIFLAENIETGDKFAMTSPEHSLSAIQMFDLGNVKRNKDELQTCVGEMLEVGNSKVQAFARKAKEVLERIEEIEFPSGDDHIWYLNTPRGIKKLNLNFFEIIRIEEDAMNYDDRLRIALYDPCDPLLKNKNSFVISFEEFGEHLRIYKFSEAGDTVGVLICNHYDPKTQPINLENNFHLLTESSIKICHSLKIKLVDENEIIENKYLDCNIDLTGNLLGFNYGEDEYSKSVLFILESSWSEQRTRVSNP